MPDSSGLYRLQDGSGIDSVTGKFTAVDNDTHHGQSRHLLRPEIARSRNRGENAEHGSPEIFEAVQVGAEDLRSNI